MKRLLLNIAALTLGVLIFMTSGCRKDYTISEKQVILFQYDYVNYAWGYQQQGFIIDNEGNVLVYNNPDEWNISEKDYILTEEQVSENLEKCIHSGKKIARETLLKYSGFIPNIASSKVSAPKNVGADAGTTSFICYQYNESTGTYKGYLIRMEGDFTSENLNFYSKKITVWMKDINSGIPSN